MIIRSLTRCLYVVQPIHIVLTIEVIKGHVSRIQAGAACSVRPTASHMDLECLSPETPTPTRAEAKAMRGIRLLFRSEPGIQPKTIDTFNRAHG